MNKKNLLILLSAIVIVFTISFFFFQQKDKPKLGVVPETDVEQTEKNETKPIIQALDDSGATQEGIQNIVDANNQFALDFYANLKGQEEGKNIFFSPYSISTALTMMYEGARGETAEEIQSVFHFSKDDAERRSSIAAIYNRLNKKDVKYELKTANALWIQKDFQLLNDFTETVKNFYGGKTTNVDFVEDTEQSRQTINSWVEEQTNNKIKDLFPQGSLNAMTRLVLTNAIYFKGDWASQFDKKDTRDEYFQVSQSEKIKVPMMRQTGEKFNYIETEKLQILEMLYEGEELSMIVLLPKNNDLISLENSLTTENLNQWRNELRDQRVDVYIPKFTFDSKYFMNENLKAMGMPLAFTGNADFSGIDGTQKLFIGAVIHQAFIDVNEEGTEAAAATGVGIIPTSIMPVPAPVFRADHPFIFLIQERETGNILFMGRVVNPLK